MVDRVHGIGRAAETPESTQFECTYGSRSIEEERRRSSKSDQDKVRLPFLYEDSHIFLEGSGHSGGQSYVLLNRSI